jgi:hypothetical protein
MVRMASFKSDPIDGAFSMGGPIEAVGLGL